MPWISDMSKIRIGIGHQSSEEGGNQQDGVFFKLFPPASCRKEIYVEFQRLTEVILLYGEQFLGERFAVNYESGFKIEPKAAHIQID